MRVHSVHSRSLRGKTGGVSTGALPIALWLSTGGLRCWNASRPRSPQRYWLCARRAKCDCPRGRAQGGSGQRAEGCLRGRSFLGGGRAGRRPPLEWATLLLWHCRRPRPSPLLHPPALRAAAHPARGGPPAAASFPLCCNQRPQRPSKEARGASHLRAEVCATRDALGLHVPCSPGHTASSALPARNTDALQAARGGAQQTAHRGSAEGRGSAAVEWRNFVLRVTSCGGGEWRSAMPIGERQGARCAAGEPRGVRGAAGGRQRPAAAAGEQHHRTGGGIGVGGQIGVGRGGSHRGGSTSCRRSPAGSRCARSASGRSPSGGGPSRAHRGGGGQRGRRAARRARPD